jgi:hypothetical protein
MERGRRVWLEEIFILLIFLAIYIKANGSSSRQVSTGVQQAARLAVGKLVRVRTGTK